MKYIFFEIEKFSPRIVKKQWYNGPILDSSSEYNVKVKLKKVNLNDAVDVSIWIEEIKLFPPHVRTVSWATMSYKHQE